jgi:hypothetical protein
MCPPVSFWDPENRRPATNTWASRRPELSAEQEADLPAQFRNKSDG